MSAEVIRQLERAASRIEKRWRQPSTEGAPLDLFFAFEPTRQECPDIEINGVMVNAMVPYPEIMEARLQAIAAVEKVLRDRYGADTEMNEWSDVPERTAEEAAGVVRDAIAMIATRAHQEAACEFCGRAFDAEAICVRNGMTMAACRDHVAQRRHA